MSNASPLTVNGVASKQTPQGQQAAFLQNAKLPAADMSFLNNVTPETLAAIMQAIQSGALPMPPTFGNAPQPSAAPPIPQPIQRALHVPEPGHTAQAKEQAMNIDKEEGEVEEGEVDDTPSDRVFLRPPPTGPRNRSSSPRNRQVRDGQVRRESSRNGRRTPPGGPVGRRVSDQMSVRGDRYVPNQGRLPSKRMRDSPPASQPAAKRTTNGRRQVTKAAAVREFVREMYKNGYGFEQLAKDVDDPKHLRELFVELGLPVPTEAPASTVKPDTNGATNTQPAAVSEIAKPAPNTTQPEARKASMTKRPAPPKPVAPKNREEYLAKLKAAVSKQPGATAQTASTPPAAPAATAVPAPPEPVEMRTEKVAEPSMPLEAQQKTRKATGGMNAEKTALARQRLAEFKAQQAAKAATSSGALTSSPAPVVAPAAIPANDPRPTQPSLGAGLETVATMAAQQQAPSMPVADSPTLQPQAPMPAPVRTAFPPPVPPTPIRTFSGLPGLGGLPGLSMSGSPFNARPFTQTFAPPPPPQHAQPELASEQSPQPVTQRGGPAIMATATQAVMSPVASPAPLEVPRKRAVASDFDDPPVSNYLPKRPFGQPRNSSIDDRLVIRDISDDEDDDVMDLEDRSAQPEPIEASSKQRSIRDMGPLRDFPPQPSLQKQSNVPMSGTPPVSTPGGTALWLHEAELEAMKRKLAMMEQRKKKTSGKATPISAIVSDGAPAAPASAAAGHGDAIPVQPALAIDTASAAPGKQVSPSPGTSARSGSVASGKPMSAIALAKKQLREREREALMRRMAELEAERSDEEEAMDESPVNTRDTAPQAGANPGPIVSDGFAAIQPPIEHPQAAVHERQDLVGTPVAPLQANTTHHTGQDAVSVAGEQMSEGVLPVSKAQNAVLYAAPAENDDKVGSQATTASATTVADAEQQPSATVATLPLELDENEDLDSDMSDLYEPKEVSGEQEGNPALVLQPQLHGQHSRSDDGGTPEGNDVLDGTQTAQHDHDHDRDQDMEQSSDDGEIAIGEDGEVDDVASSSASSSRSDEYEPDQSFANTPAAASNGRRRLRWTATCWSWTRPAWSMCRSWRPP